MSSSSAASPLEVRVEPGRPPMAEIEPVDDPASWAARNRDSIRVAVTEHGALHVRGLPLSDVAEVGAVANHLTTDLMADREAFASRDPYPSGVYSSSAWPPKQQMCMHHELSYRFEFPGLMLFGCLAAPTSGGTIALADSPTVLSSLPADLVERFEREGWMLVRNYTEEIGSSVAEAFGTDDASAVESYCETNQIEYEWQPDGGLRTRQRRRAVLDHPATGERCWFNQIAFLSEWTLDPEVREFLVDMYGSDGLPFNTRFGNGDPIDEDVVETINLVYEEHAVREPLAAGDLVLVDNIRTAHGRDPFDGPREVIVALGDEVRLSDLSSLG